MYLQAQQDALNKHHQVEKETAKMEISELRQHLEEVQTCALHLLCAIAGDMISYRCVRVFVLSNTPERRRSSLTLK